MSDTGARQLMAKMTAHGLVISDVRGGKVQIETCDVAAALAMGERPLSNEAYVMGRVKYCDDDLYVPRLQRIVFSRLTEVAGREPPQGVVAVCLREGVWRPMHRACGGRGCPRCLGTGLMRATSRDRAKRADVGKDTYRRHWARPVERVLMNMDGWAQECLWHLYDQFRRGELPREARPQPGERVRYTPPWPDAEALAEKKSEKISGEEWQKKQALWPVLGLPDGENGSDRH